MRVYIVRVCACACACVSGFLIFVHLCVGLVVGQVDVVYPALKFHKNDGNER